MNGWIWIAKEHGSFDLGSRVRIPLVAWRARGVGGAFSRKDGTKNSSSGRLVERKAHQIPSPWPGPKP